MGFKFLGYLLIAFSINATAQDDIIGRIIIYKTEYEDNFYDIARKFDLGIDELIYANPGIDPWIPGDGAELIIPSMHILPSKPHQGIVINKAELRLYFFPKNSDAVITFPVSIGILGHETPEGITSITAKQLDPYWISPPSMRLENPDIPEFIPPGANNPLGKYALYLGWQSIIIHSTNKPWSIGAYGSHGCIRMYPEDAKILFHKVKVGTPVRIVNEPIKLGFIKGDLYIEVSPSSKQSVNLQAIKANILNKYKKDAINEELLDKILVESSVIPIRINK